MKIAVPKDRVGSVQEYKALQARYAALDVETASLDRGKLSEVHARLDMVRLVFVACIVFSQATRSSLVN